MPTVLDAAALRQLCKDAGGYCTPQLNDKVYGNYRGFDSVCSEALGRYTAIKALFLEGNALASLGNLPELPSLVCLCVGYVRPTRGIITSHRFVQHNAIDSLHGLHSLRNLVTINISNNCITTLDGLEHCPHLTTLHAANNQIASAHALAPLQACPQLATLDLHSNKVCPAVAKSISLRHIHTQLEDSEVVDVLAAIPALASLYLTGNPLVSHTRHYRNTLIVLLPALQYLDDRPVFGVDRAAAEAWYVPTSLGNAHTLAIRLRKCGGLEAERAARSQWVAAQHAQQQEDAAFMVRLRTSSSLEVCRFSVHI